MPKRLVIEKMFAFIAEDEEGEGVCGFQDPVTGDWAPMVGADMKRIESLTPIAQHISNESKKKIRLVLFSERREIRLIQPRAGS
jgi:hypothetical protein